MPRALRRRPAFPLRSGKLLFGLVLLAAIAAGCGPSDPAAAGAASAGGGRGGGRGGRGAGGGGPVPVVTAQVVAKPMPLSIAAVGTAEAFTTVQVRSQVTGQLSAVHFTEGQDVRKGQLLFTLDPRPFQATLQQAEAVLAKDTAQAKNAQAQAARYDDLYKRGLIARDQYETQLAGSNALQATLAADEANVEQTRLNLQYTRIASPIDGRTGALMSHPGDLIRANDTNPIVVINQLSPIRVTFSVPGRFISDIRKYQGRSALRVEALAPTAVMPGSQVVSPATQSAGSSDDPPAAAPDNAASSEGTVTFIDNTVDPTTGTIKLKGTFPNTDHRLWPGLFVQVKVLLTTEQQAITVPATALQTTQDGQFVYVVKADETVDFRPIAVQRQVGNEVVVARGLQPGETVVTDGQLRLTPGVRVTTRHDEVGPGGPGRRGQGQGRRSSQ